MALQGKKLDVEDQRRIARMANVRLSKTEIARIVGISRPTAYKYAAKETARNTLGTFYTQQQDYLMNEQ